MRYREPRKPIEKATKIYTPSGIIRVTLRSISSSGAKADGLSPLPTGTDVTVELLSSMRSAKVIWRRGDSVGLKFEKPLNAAELAAIHRPGSVSKKDLKQSPHNSFGYGFQELR